jgi:hypothetical protein
MVGDTLHNRSNKNSRREIHMKTMLIILLIVALVSIWFSEMKRITDNER